MGAKGKSEKRSAWEKLAKFDTCPRSKQSFSIVAKRRVQAVPFHSGQAAGPSSPFLSWPSSGSKQSCSIVATQGVQAVLFLLLFS
ncbi:hypothetical protein NL676_009515 [Syzygium grande]|nr:hypothetical protein NL676_009515 [Syzygium grande]